MILNLLEQKAIKNISGDKIIINIDHLQNGIYFILLTKENKTIASDKMVISD